MLCIDRDNFAKAFQISDEEMRVATDKVAKTGILLSYLQSFNGGGGAAIDGKSPAKWLSTEPDGQRKLCLVGMSDRYGDGSRTGAEIQEIKLTPEELRAQFEQLAERYAWPGWRDVFGHLLGT